MPHVSEFNPGFKVGELSKRCEVSPLTSGQMMYALARNNKAYIQKCDDIYDLTLEFELEQIVLTQLLGGNDFKKEQTKEDLAYIAKRAVQACEQVLSKLHKMHYPDSSALNAIGDTDWKETELGKRINDGTFTGNVLTAAQESRLVEDVDYERTVIS